MTKNEEFLKACHACIKNAGQYIKDAEKLKEVESYGHGYALAAIASEELSKAMYFHWVYHGVIQYNRKLIRDHEFKLWLQGVVSIVIRNHAEIVSMMDEIASSSSAESEEEKIKQVFKTSVTTLSDESSLIREFAKEMKRARKIQKAKEKGLYVDLEGGHLLTPRETKPEALQEFLEELKRHKEVVEKTIEGYDKRMPPELREAAFSGLKDALKTLRKNSKKLELKLEEPVKEEET